MRLSFRSSRQLATLALVPTVLFAVSCGGSDTPPADQSSAGEEKPALFAQLPEEIQRSGVLRNGADFTYPPLEFTASDGTTFTGVDLDLAEAVSKKLGVELENTNAAFGTLIPQLQSRRLDVVFSFATVTEERMEAVDFIEYSQSGTAMMVRKGNPDGIKTIDDLCGKGVGVQSGAVQVPIAEEASTRCVAAGKPPIEITQLGKDSEVQMLLRSGRIAVDLLDSPVAVYSAAQGDEFEVIPGERYSVRPHGVMVLKGNTQLAETIRAALQELMDDGTYAEILDKYDVPDLAVPEATISAAG
ncbi:ABC transporter substrate-binding protein [Mycolicibacterium austroafricanum]|uniref:ABC transporter substrate-binding protein n=1 Tax=Mycolicibacterium austroafricanum TaxID=39687 RepID=UPI001CA31FF4|nr:ABC transporter substrate-binding protein [Mycolicibacterium austroafricanum]QZT64257.1 ABC transporter substrate-binding protein [Mycolicibacterium austroafricanum]